mmetsp:Transcript_120464/g.225172  ORF Transcript_120464/g.225172 Transcript_120464/m.225172 type:complete len:307 (-) Transcript_120464:143-1063(-)
MAVRAVGFALLLFGCICQSHRAPRKWPFSPDSLGEEHQTLTALATLLLSSSDPEVAWQASGPSTVIPTVNQVSRNMLADTTGHSSRIRVPYTNTAMQLNDGLGQMNRRSLLGMALAAASAASLPSSADALGLDGTGDVYEGYYLDMEGGRRKIKLTTSFEEAEDGIRFGTCEGGKKNKKLAVKAIRELKIQIDFAEKPLGPGKRKAKMIVTEDGEEGLQFEDDEKEFWLKEDTLDVDLTEEQLTEKRLKKEKKIQDRIERTRRQLAGQRGTLDREILDIVQARQNGIDLKPIGTVPSYEGVPPSGR